MTVVCDRIVKGKFPDSHEYSRVSRAATASEHELADRYRYIAYSVHYSITFPEGSAILRLGQGATLGTVFYPFQRPFFHRAEAQLDTALYQRLVDGLLEDLDRKAQARALADAAAQDGTRPVVNVQPLVPPMSGLSMNGTQGSKLGGFPDGQFGFPGSGPTDQGPDGVTTKAALNRTSPIIANPDGSMEIQKYKINMFMGMGSKMKIEEQSNPFPAWGFGSLGGTDTHGARDYGDWKSLPNKDKQQVTRDKKKPKSKTEEKSKQKQMETRLKNPAAQ